MTTAQIDIKNESQRSAHSQQVTSRHQQTDVHESITKQDRNNIKDPQKKHHLGTVRKTHPDMTDELLNRLIVIFQKTARNHFWEAGMLMQSYILETVQ